MGGPEVRSSVEAHVLYQDPQVRSIFGFSAIFITAAQTIAGLAVSPPLERHDVHDLEHDAGAPPPLP
jgi:hypothetical protein